MSEGSFAAREADRHEKRDGSHLEHGENVLHHRPLAKAPRVDPGKDGDDPHRHELRAGQREGARGENDVALSNVQPHASQELGEADRDRGDRPGLDDGEEGPPVQERDDGPKSFA